MAGAIKAIIATQFDDTGIKKASKQFGDLGKTLKSTLGAVGLTVGLAAITNGLKEASKAAVEDVKSQALLAQQLRNTVGASNEAIASAEGYINSLMLQTSIADDQLRPALATLVRSTQDVGEAQSLLALSTDIAAGTGKDLGTVSQAVAKAADGQTTALFRLVPSLKGSADWAKQAGDEFGGMAEAAANTDPFQRINIIMGEMQETIGMALLPTLNEFAAWFASAEGQAKLQEFVDLIVKGIGFLTDFATWIGENISWLSQLAIGIGVTTAAVSLFNLALNTNPIMLAITAIGLLVTAFAALNSMTDTAAAGVPGAVRAGAIKAGQKAYEAVRRNPKNFEQTSTGPQLKAGTDMKAEAAKNKAYNDAINSYKEAQNQIERNAFVPPTAYVKPVVPTVPTIPGLSAATKTAGSSAPKKIPTTALAKTTAELKALSKAMLTSDGDIGKLIDGFDAITKKLDEGLANGALTKKGAKNLKDYVATEKALFVELGKQREELANKRSLAETLIADVKAAIVGVGNLGNLLDDTGNGIVANLRKIVEKTKAFAIQLATLKSMGLDPALFQQIVDAGAEAGGAIASEIIKGGPASVSELNGLFGELNTVGGQIAEQTAQVMFGAGEDVTNGLINGLMSREQALISAAKTLAASFNAAFNASVITAGITSPSMPSASSSAASSQTNNTINISVKASAGTNTKKVGQDIVNAINTYAKAN